MASPATDNIRVAIRVRPLIKRENDFHSQTHWRVDRNTITQVNNGKLLSNSSYSFDRIFDVSNTTQDVYDEFGQPTVLSAMDGFNGTLFAYGQTSSGKTYTMMGDQRNEGVIPKAVGEIYDYIEKHPSREFLIRVSYMEIYNEDIKDLLNPAKTNLKIHENPQKQVYVGDLTEEVVSCGEDVFKHMLRGEKNRHFGETNMNDRSSRSHTIFRVVIESREMMDESKDPDTIDGAVRVAHLNLVDLAGSERASQTGAFGQRLKEGGHINKSLLALGSVIAKLSEGESFVPFRDSKLTRILQSSLGGNAKTSMVCTITPAAVEETISTLKFASRAKTIKNCPEVNEVLDDGTLLKRYRKEICELKKQLVEISQQSTISQMQELQIEKEKMVEMLEQQRIQQSEQEEKIKRLRNMICTAGREDDTKSSKAKLAKRRLTWCPGAALSKAPLASAAAVQARLQRISSSPSSEESEFDEMAKDAFFSSLNREEERRSNEFSRRRVGFVSPQAARCLSPVLDTELEDKDIQTEPDERIIELQKEVKKLRRNLDEAERTRDLYNELLVESNELLEKMSTEKGLSPSSMNSDVTLRYVAELRNEKADLEAQLEVLKTQNQDLEPLQARNKELEDQVQSLENERTLSNEYLSELQAEYDSAQAEKEALAARVEGLENTGVFNQAAKMELDSLEMKLEESMKEKEQLQGNLEFWKEKYSTLESEVAGLQNELARTAAEENTEALISCNKTEIDSLHMVLEESIKEKQQLQENVASWKEKFSILEEELTNLQNQLAQVASEKVQLEEKMACVMTKASGNTKELEDEMKELRERLSSAHEQERMLSDVIEQKLQLEETIETLKAEMEQNKDTSNDKGSIETRYEQLGVEKEIEIKKIMEDLNQLQQQLKEKSDEVEEKDALVAQVIEQKRKVQETFDMFKVDTENERAELNQQVEQLRAELKEKMGFIQEKAAMLSEIEQQKCEADSNLLEVRASKEKEIASLNEEMEQIRAEIQEKLCGLEEKESMLTEVIQQKCELEEKFEIFKGEKENQARQLIQKMEELRSELQNRENGTDGKANVAEETTQEKYVVEEQLKIFREEKENQIAKLMEDIGLLQSEMEEKALILQEKEKLLSETFQQKSELESFKMEKESEIQKLNDRMKELEVQLREKTSTAEEKENCLNEMIQLKSDAEEELKTYRLEKESELEKLRRQLEESDLEKDNVNQSLDSEEKQVMLLKAKVSDQNIQLEKTINEKKELEQMLERVKKERDEIKNDLSETITDTAELQKDVFEMQQKVKRYKEHIYELESELEERGTSIATYKEKIDDLQQQLNQRIDQLATGDQETTSKDHSEQEDFASLPAQEKQRAQEITEECSVLKSAVKQLENAKHDLENETQKLHQEADELREKIYDLDERLVESENARKFSEQRLQEEQEKYDKLVKDYNSNGCRACKDLEALLAESRQVSVAAEKQLEGERAKFRELTKEIEEYKSNDLRPGDKDNTVSLEAELQKVKTESEELVKELTEERKAHESLRKEHSTQTEELQHLRDSLLRDTNRGMDQQRVIDKMKAERRETICVQAQQRQELEKDLHEAEKKVSELESQCSLLKSEKDVLEHRLEVANKKVEETKQEMRDLENLYNTHNTLSVTQLDDNKAVQKLKQMEFSLDLTKQKCEKAVSRVKELETENRQMRGADIRNGALLEERNNLKQQVQQAKHALDEKSKKLNEFSIEVTQLRAHVDKLSEENKKNRSSLEKKENKIDSLEQKLWEMEEDLKMERQRCQEQQSQSVAVDELNSTIRVKHEELEHMTFLVDEKDIEIAEVRSSLEENETKRTEMAEKMQELEQRLNELDNDLENANKNLQEAKTGQEEADARVEELKAIIKQQEVEIISMTEKLESGKANNEIQTQELDSKTQKLESDLQDTEHKLLEVESELEFTKTSWEKATSEKDELIKILRAYSEVLNDSHRADLNEDAESLKAQLKPNLERLSGLFKTTNEVEDLSNKLKETIKGSQSLEQKLSEVQTSFQEQKSALEEEVDELRESVLNEKKLVFELEDKLKFAVNDKNAMEAELRRVLEENKTIVTEDDVEIKIASSESEAGLEFGKAKENVMQLENEVERLKKEISTLENQVKINSIARDEEKKAWDEEMARCTERYEGEKEQLVEQLREISDLKVKESEDFCADKDEKIEELESKLLNASKTAADYERTVEHYHLKLAELEYERDTAVERLEKQSSTSNSSDNREVESLRKECELAKKKSKDAQEKYFSESDRLKAIIDEMQDEQEEFLRQMNELKEKTAKQDAEISQLRNELTETKKTTHDSTNSSSYADSSEMESLKKECELAKKKCKDAQEKYFSESDRLKAIIDDMQEEQDDLICQINDFEVKTSKKDAEISQLQNELSEMKEIAQAVKAQNKACFKDRSNVEHIERECVNAKKLAKEIQEKYSSESGKLKAIIREQQEIIDRSQMKQDTEDEMEATRIDLAQKNMQIQSLQYDLYKLQEKYDKETRTLSKEVEWGRERVGSLKLEIRRLKEPEEEDTISMIRGQVVPAQKNEVSNVGVVSNVAIYSLKAKVGKLESETERLREKVQQLEKEKATLSLLNTESSNKIAQLTSENKALKTQKKKLMEGVPRAEVSEVDSDLKGDSGRRLPEVPTETLERESKNSSILGLSTVENVSLPVPTAERKRIKPEAKKENFQNWLSADAADNMFKEEPNQCANQ